MATSAVPANKIGSSLESLRLAALRSRAKQRVPSLSKAAEAAFEREEGELSDDRSRNGADRTRTPSPVSGNEYPMPAPLSSVLDPKLLAAAVAALSDLSRAGLSYQDLLTLGDIHPLFLSNLVSSISLPPSSPATETSRAAETSMSSPAPKSEAVHGGDDKDMQLRAFDALADLSGAGLSYDDIVQLGGINPLYLAQLVSQMSPDLPRHAELLEKAMLTVREAAATVGVTPTSVPSSGAVTPSTGPVKATAHVMPPAPVEDRIYSKPHKDTAIDVPVVLAKAEKTPLEVVKPVPQKPVADKALEKVVPQKNVEKPVPVKAAENIVPPKVVPQKTVDKPVPVKAVEKVAPVKAAPVKAVEKIAPVTAVEKIAPPVKAVEKIAPPVKAAPVKVAPVKPAPVKVAPVEAAPVKAAEKVAPVEAVAKIAPVKAAPMKAVEKITPVEAVEKVAPVKAAEKVVPQKAVTVKAAEKSADKAAARPRVVSNGQTGITIIGNSVNVARTVRKRPTAMELGGTGNQPIKFGSDRFNGKMVIEMSDSEEDVEPEQNGKH